MVSDTTCHMSISLDGFVAGPDQSREDPLGKRGRELHGWHIGDPRANDADKIANEWLMRPRGAYVMGRNMFGPIRGDWDEDWSGWWGPEPPYHAPVFVLTHHRRHSIQMDGGTTFHFVTEGFEAAYSAACEAAGGNGVDIAGGASTVRQALAAGVIDELTLDILEREMYTETAAARLLRVAPSTLHWWLEGRPPRYRPVIRTEPTGSRSVTWAEFVEAGLLRSYRRDHDVPLKELRDFIDRLREEFQVSYPLADRRPFVGPARRLLIDLQGRSQLDPDFCLVAVANGQIVLTAAGEAFYERVDWSGKEPVS